MFQGFIFHAQNKILLVKKLKLSWNFSTFCLWSNAHVSHYQFPVKQTNSPYFNSKESRLYNKILHVLTCKDCTFLSSSAMYWSFRTLERWANCLHCTVTKNYWKIYHLKSHPKICQPLFRFSHFYTLITYSLLALKNPWNHNPNTKI